VYPTRRSAIVLMDSLSATVQRACAHSAHHHIHMLSHHHIHMLAHHHIHMLSHHHIHMLSHHHIHMLAHHHIHMLAHHHIHMLSHHHIHMLAHHHIHMLAHHHIHMLAQASMSSSAAPASWPTTHLAPVGQEGQAGHLASHPLQHAAGAVQVALARSQACLHLLKQLFYLQGGRGGGGADRAVSITAE
jgi:hypothetical protein